MKDETNPLLPVAIQPNKQLALEKKIAKKILLLKPGFGESVWHHAEALADSGLSPTQAMMLVDAIYAPTTAKGGGQAARAGWFVKTIRERYGSRLDYIGGNLALFKGFLAHMDEVIENRTALSDIDISFSFHEAMMLDEVGVPPDEVTRVMEDLGVSKWNAKRIVMKAVRILKDGGAATLEGAIQQAS
jgi:hypothetical protein